MASILQVGEKWRALVRRKGHKSQCKTFRTKAQAEAWARQVETDIDGGGAVAQPGKLTVGEVIQAYRRLRDEARPISDQSNEHYMLKALERGLGAKQVHALTPADLISYATMRREEGAGPYTINMDLSKLGTAMRFGGAALKVALPDAVGAARPMLAHLRLIGGGGKRERRPQDDELQRILAYLGEKRGQPYADATAFAAITAMRQGEVCAIRWKDVDGTKHLVGVDRKHPRKGKVWELVPILGEAWDILQRQPKGEDRIFPLHHSTLSKYFTEACRALSIPDLHFHDLRHEGTSAMFESGMQIHEVALVTGHKSWSHLKRYTNLRPEDLTKPPAPAPRPSARQRPGSRRTASRTPSKS